MKMVFITCVSDYEKDIMKLLEEAEVNAFSAFNIEGYRNEKNELDFQSWFPYTKLGSESLMFFSFETLDKIRNLFNHIRKHNNSLATNPVKAVVMPIDESI
jgi:hypothetical protein